MKPAQSQVLRAQSLAQTVHVGHDPTLDLTRTDQMG